MHEFTAARDATFRSLVRVTDLRIGMQTIHINDRRPFVANLVMISSLSAAQAIGIVGPGTATIHLGDIGADPRKASSLTPFARSSRLRRLAFDDFAGREPRSSARLDGSNPAMCSLEWALRRRHRLGVSASSPQDCAGHISLVGADVGVHRHERIEVGRADAFVRNWKCFSGGARRRRRSLRLARGVQSGEIDGPLSDRVVFKRGFDRQSRVLPAREAGSVRRRPSGPNHGPASAFGFRSRGVGRAVGSRRQKACGGSSGARHRRCRPPRTSAYPEGRLSRLARMPSELRARRRRTRGRSTTRSHSRLRPSRWRRRTLSPAFDVFITGAFERLPMSKEVTLIGLPFAQLRFDDPQGQGDDDERLSAVRAHHKHVAIGRPVVQLPKAARSDLHLDHTIDAVTAWSNRRGKILLLSPTTELVRRRSRAPAGSEQARVRRGRLLARAFAAGFRASRRSRFDLLVAIERWMRYLKRCQS